MSRGLKQSMSKNRTPGLRTVGRESCGYRRIYFRLGLRGRADPLINRPVRSCSAGLACLQAATEGFIAENPFRSVIGRLLGFLRRALPGQPSTRPRPSRANSRWRPHCEFRFFSTIQPPACRLLQAITT